MLSLNDSVSLQASEPYIGIRDNRLIRKPCTPQAQAVLITYNFRLMNKLINIYYVIHYGPLT